MLQSGLRGLCFLPGLLGLRTMFGAQGLHPVDLFDRLDPFFMSVRRFGFGRRHFDFVGVRLEVRLEVRLHGLRRRAGHRDDKGFPLHLDTIGCFFLETYHYSGHRNSAGGELGHSYAVNQLGGLVQHRWHPLDVTVGQINHQPPGR